MPKRHLNVHKEVRGDRIVYRARHTFPKDPLTGTRPPAKDFRGKTEAAAVAKRDAFRKRYNQHAAAGGKSTLARFIVDDFMPHELARYRVGELSWNQYRARKSRLERFIVKNTSAAGRLRALRMAHVTPAIVERLFRALLADATVSARIYNEFRKDLRVAFRFGKRSLPERWDDYFADIPERSVPKRQKKLFDADTVLDRIHDERRPLFARAFVAFIFVLNCRLQDMFALRWSDLDLRKGLVFFRFAVKYVEGGFDVREGSKTGEFDGEALPIGALLTALLQRLYDERIAAGKAFPWVFCRGDGKPHNNSSFRYEWTDIKADLDLPDGPTPYSLKTLGNSYWLSHNVPVAVQARKMRHKDERMAQRDYRAIFPRELHDAVTLEKSTGSEG